MAKESNNLDQFFKEKLDQHSEKPSALAWERLESKLPNQRKSKTVYWWAAAASIGIMLSIGYYLQVDNRSEEVFIAQEVAVDELSSPSNQDSTPAAGEVLAPILEKTDSVRKDAAPRVESAPVSPRKKEQIQEVQPSQNLVAMTDATREKEKPEPVVVPETDRDPTELSRPDLPAMDINKTVAEVAQPTDEEPSYKVTIFSDGIKDQKDKNLIAGLGKTVGQVEGILGKVDQGFAELQDAKNNLFASLTSKKERTAEKP